jgi:hypothetical protein
MKCPTDIEDDSSEDNERKKDRMVSHPIGLWLVWFNPVTDS